MPELSIIYLLKNYLLSIYLLNGDLTLNETAEVS